MIGWPPVKLLREVFAVAQQRFNESADRMGLLSPLKAEAKAKSRGWAAANEPAITHRLAYYLETELHDAKIIRADDTITLTCYYNRHIDAEKKLHTTLIGKEIVERAGRTTTRKEGTNDFFEFLVVPDLIVHEMRNDERNLLVIETKKSTERNKRLHQYDDLKLRLFTSRVPWGFGYRVGISVIIADNLAPADRELQTAGVYLEGEKAE